MADRVELSISRSRFERGASSIIKNFNTQYRVTLIKGGKKRNNVIKQNFYGVCNGLRKKIIFLCGVVKVNCNKSVI